MDELNLTQEPAAGSTDDPSSAVSSDWDEWEDNYDDLASAGTGEDTGFETEADSVSEADQPEETAAGTDDTAGNEAETPDQTFTLKHLDDVRTVTRDEVIALAQKGLDYDRIREKLTQAQAAGKAAEDETKDQMEFLAEMAAEQGKSVPDFMDDIRAAVIAKKEGVDAKVALGIVKNRNESRRLEREKNALVASKADDSRNEARQTAIRDFVAEYPGLKAEEIPHSVWAEFSKSGNLISAYRAHENQTLKQKISDLEAKVAAAEKNSKNKSRSTGSQKGSAAEGRSPFDILWYDGT